MLKNLVSVPQDPIFKALAAYQVDANPQKVNLGIGLYADEDGNTYVPDSVKQVFAEVDRDNFNYQPIGGNRDYLEATARLVLGDEVDCGGLALQATCGGTQACSLFADLIKQDEVKRKLIVGHPTWGNHYVIFRDLEVERFEHLGEDGRVNFEAYKQALMVADPGSILLLHGGLTHNPTGRNLSYQQLEQLVPLLREKEIVVFMDAAYLGFGDGFAEDAAFARLLFNELDHFACGVSYSKNAALYEHRTGALMIKTDRKEVIESQLQVLARKSISMAPGIGQEMMLNIMTNHKEQWLAELEQMRLSMTKRRELLADRLPEQFGLIRECRGMFGFMPLTEAQIQRLQDEFSVYILKSTRVNFGGIKLSDIDYLVEAIKSVT